MKVFKIQYTLLKKHPLQVIELLIIINSVFVDADT